ncbi:MAG: RNA polymerase sigma factor [Ktedonobacteraceae bacterium]
MLPADQAVEELIQKYSKLVFHTIYGMTGDWEESQDLTQDTFHQALKSIDAARNTSGSLFHEKAWLMRIALNTVRMQHRRRGIFRFIPFSQMQKGKQETNADEADADTLNERPAAVQPVGFGANEVDDPAVRIAERDAVQRTVARLSEPLRECLLLSILGNFSTSEIATMLDVQEAAVRQRLARARKQFQQFYALENSDNDTPATNTTTGRTQKHLPTQQHHEERVEASGGDTKLDTPSSRSWSSYGKRLYRDSATTPLW